MFGTFFSGSAFNHEFYFYSRETCTTQRQRKRARERAQEATVGRRQSQARLGEAEAKGTGQGSFTQRKVSADPGKVFFLDKVFSGSPKFFFCQDVKAFEQHKIYISQNCSYCPVGVDVHVHVMYYTKYLKSQVLLKK